MKSNYRSEALLLCGIAGNGIYSKAIQQARLGMDWVLVNGKVRDGGFIQARDLCIVNRLSADFLPIHHVALLGEISAIREQAGSIYNWQFDIVVHHEYGDDKTEATLTCGIGSSASYTELIQSAHSGQWASVQGKVRNNSFIQVRSLKIFSLRNDN